MPEFPDNIPNWILPKIISEPLNPVHLLVEDGHDADGAVFEQLPIDEVPLIATDEAADAEFRRDGEGRERRATVTSFQRKLESLCSF